MKKLLPTCAKGIGNDGRRKRNEGDVMLVTDPWQNGIIALVMAFLISPYGLPLVAIWLLGKVQDLKFTIQDWVYR